jgi:signal peptide peptidase SppA
MKAPLIHVAGLVFNEPLAIMPAKLAAILQAIGPRLNVNDAALDELLKLHSIPARPVLLEDAVMFNAQIDQSRDGENSKPYRLTPEGVAVIPVRGTLMKRFSYLSAVSGCSTYASLAQAATQAMGDPQVKGVLLDVDSPGGTTHGCFELSDALYQLRGEKPMWAIANDLAASAAYALASSADRVFLTRTAGVGSVGVFALHADQSAQDEQAGIKYSYIFAGEKKIDGNPHEPLARSARADIQAEVDREYDMFVATVARNRGFAGATVPTVRATKAGVYFAEDATPLLADDVATYEEALEALTQKVNGSRLKGIGSGKVALQTEPGNNVREIEAAKEGDAMPKPDTEEKRASAEEVEASAAAAQRDDEDDDDEPQKDAKAKPFEKGKAKAKAQDEECDDKAETARRAPVAQMPVANTAKQIAEMCQIAGAPELAATYIVAGHSLEKVIEKLNARRAKASAEGNVNSYVAGDNNPGGGGQQSVDHAIEQARTMSANSGGRLTQSQCMEKILRGNPDIYSGYLEERGRVASQVAFTGGGRALTEYVLNNQRRYLANLGLGTTIDDVPGRRPM